MSESTSPTEQSHRSADAAATAIRCGRSVYERPNLLAADLENLRAVGYDAGEVALDATGAIIGGRLVERAVDRIAAICDAQAGALIYSVHAPAVLDLRDRRDPDLHRGILLASVRFSAAIGARVLVVHYEARSEDAAIEEQYRASIAEAAELAGQHGLILGIENIEVERAERVLEFVAAMRHPWVRMTYDFAHDYLAGDLFGYDHLASARACAPLTAHIHITDNFGRFNHARLGDFNLYRAIPYHHILATGLGDLHLPIGWGTLPMEAAFAPFAASGYSGLVISEHEMHVFTEAHPEVCRRLRSLTAR